MKRLMKHWALSIVPMARYTDKENALAQWRRVDEAATFSDHRPKPRRLFESCHFGRT